MYYIFTDGSVNRKEDIHSSAWVLTNGDEILDYDFEVRNGSNSAEAEVYAIYMALKKIKELPTTSIVWIISDSEYCVNAMTIWLKNWVKEKKDVKFYDIWEKISILQSDMNNLFVIWTRSHEGTFYNEIVDEICKEALGI